MGWERRARGGWYYTRSKRRGGRVVREYIGTGALAESISQLDAHKREALRARHEELASERRRSRDADQVIATLDDWTVTLVRASLILAGYRQHDRGEWRRHRGRRIDAQEG